MADYVYRVVREDGAEAWEGRGSDPFTSLSSAKRRASQLTNKDRKDTRLYGDNPRPAYKVQKSVVYWEDM